MKDQRIVELVKCPVCRCSKVKDEPCTMCPLLEEEAIEAPHCSGCNNRHEPSMCPHQ